MLKSQNFGKQSAEKANNKTYVITTVMVDFVLLWFIMKLYVYVQNSHVD